MDEDSEDESRGEGRRRRRRRRPGASRNRAASPIYMFDMKIHFVLAHAAG
jgi:hypothetical protein